MKSVRKLTIEDLIEIIQQTSDEIKSEQVNDFRDRILGQIYKAIKEYEDYINSRKHLLSDDFYRQIDEQFRNALSLCLLNA